MIRHIFQTIGISGLADFDLLLLTACVLCSCMLAGGLADLILGDAAFGAVLNGLLLFLFLVVGVIGYNELVENVRTARPNFVLSLSMSIAFVMLFGASIAKNKIERS